MHHMACSRHMNHSRVSGLCVGCPRPDNFHAWIFCLSRDAWASHSSDWIVNSERASAGVNNQVHARTCEMTPFPVHPCRTLQESDWSQEMQRHLKHAELSLRLRLQLCKLLKLKPLCLLPLPGAPKHLVKGEYGSKSAWQATRQQLTGQALSIKIGAVRAKFFFSLFIIL